MSLSRVAVKMAAPVGIVLYYHPYSFYSQKVVMTLYEKNLAFDPVVINITKGEQYSNEYLKINPRGEVPVLQDNGKIIPDSARIIDYLEDNFSNGTPKLLPHPKGTDTRIKVEKFRAIIDALPAGVITMGSFFHPELCGNPKLPFIKPVRQMLKSAEINSASNLRANAELNPSAKDTLLKKAEFQEKKHLLVTSKEEYVKILGNVEEVLDQVEKELSSHKKDNPTWWLCSQEFTVADISLTILLVRLDSLGLESYFWTDGKRPNISEYYNKVQQKPSFKKSIPDLCYHLKVLFNSQTPLGIGVGVVGFIGFVAGAGFVLKKVLF